MWFKRLPLAYGSNRPLCTQVVVSYHNTTCTAYMYTMSYRRGVQGISCPSASARPSPHQRQLQLFHDELQGSIHTSKYYQKLKDSITTNVRLVYKSSC